MSVYTDLVTRLRFYTGLLSVAKMLCNILACRAFSRRNYVRDIVAIFGITNMFKVTMANALPLHFALNVFLYVVFQDRKRDGAASKYHIMKFPDVESFSQLFLRLFAQLLDF